MTTLTGTERIARILQRRSVDRVGLYESFWPETQRKWAAGGHVGSDENLIDHFGFDLQVCGCFNMIADLDCEEEIVEQTDETKLVRNGNGALLRWWKDKSGTPEHVDFLVRDRAGWDRHIRPHLTDTDTFRRRIDFEAYRQAKQDSQRTGRYFCWGGLNVFELIHPVCGHECMLMAMALDPAWVKDMCSLYAELTIDLMQTLFTEEGPPDGVFFFEDMGFRDRPFMSPTMYEQIVWPAHERTFGYAHSQGLPVIIHSCGYIEPLLPGLIRAGMDCLQPMEVKAGMDLLKLKQAYGDRIALFGGMDARVLETNDRQLVKAELDRILPAAMASSGYILHSDHSISDRVDYDTYRFFIDYARQLGTYA